ncbi:hypothetical protein H0H87_012697 [Tephrocybe sp. NHM501043]|nr:hypothetical protein H0H87_012697 [Tephrocybe sp. NHM501043]
MQLKLFASLSLLALVKAATLAADKAERLEVLAYSETKYHGQPHAVPFEDRACQRFPTLTIKSLRIPAFYDCFLYTGQNCEGNFIEALDSVPEIIDNLHSFVCNAEEE